VELLYVTKRLVLLVTPNAGLNALFFLLPCASEPASCFQHRLAPRLRRPQQIHVFLAMRLLTGQYAAENQCLQEK